MGVIAMETSITLTEKRHRGGKNVIIDWSIMLRVVQRNTLFHFPRSHLCSTFFLMSRQKKVVTNGNTLVQRQKMKA